MALLDWFAIQEQASRPRKGTQNLSPGKLGELLAHPDRRVRLESQWSSFDH